MSKEKMVALVARDTLIHDPAVYGGAGKRETIVAGGGFRAPESYAENLIALGLAEEGKPAKAPKPDDEEKPDDEGKGGDSAPAA